MPGQLGDDVLDLGVRGGLVDEPGTEGEAGGVEVRGDGLAPGVGVRLTRGAAEPGRGVLVEPGLRGEEVPLGLDLEALLDAGDEPRADGHTDADDGTRDGDGLQRVEDAVDAMSSPASSPASPKPVEGVLGL